MEINFTDIKNDIYAAMAAEKIPMPKLMKKGYERIETKKAAFERLRGKVVLDIGCHIGVWSIFLSHVASRVIGVDRKAALIPKAEKLRDALGVSNIEFVRGEVWSLQNICEKYNPTGLFAKKVLGSVCKLPKDRIEFHRVCWKHFDVIVSDLDFTQTSYPWVFQEESDRLLVFTKMNDGKK